MTAATHAEQLPRTRLSFVTEERFPFISGPNDAGSRQGALARHLSGCKIMDSSTQCGTETERGAGGYPCRVPGTGGCINETDGIMALMDG